MALKLKKQPGRIRPRKMKDLQIEVEARRARRREDWPERLHALIESRQTAPFAWGSQDCCLWVCDCIRAQTDHDPAAGTFRGKYADKLGAARLLAKHGGVERIAEKQCEAAGFSAIAVPFAQRGDVVLVEPDGGTGPTLGVVEAGEVVVPGGDGLLWLPLSKARRAWRIG